MDSASILLVALLTSELFWWVVIGALVRFALIDAIAKGIKKAAK